MWEEQASCSHIFFRGARGYHSEGPLSLSCVCARCGPSLNFTRFASPRSPSLSPISRSSKRPRYQPHTRYASTHFMCLNGTPASSSSSLRTPASCLLSCVLGEASAVLRTTGSQGTETRTGVRGSDPSCCF